VLDPDGDGDGTDAPALAFKVGQDPASLPLLNCRDVELCQFVATQGAADQKSQDHVVAFALEGRAVGDGQQLLRLLRGQPVAQPGALLAQVGTSVRVAASSAPSMPFFRASQIIFRTAESRTFIVEGESDSMPARRSINKDRERGWLAQKAKRSSSAWRSCA
jgi:hypothetical protein